MNEEKSPLLRVANGKAKTSPYTGAWDCYFEQLQLIFLNKRTCKLTIRYQYFVVFTDYYTTLYLFSKYFHINMFETIIIEKIIFTQEYFKKHTVSS